jgi:hypothetical protein
MDSETAIQRPRAREKARPLEGARGPYNSDLIHGATRADDGCVQDGGPGVGEWETCEGRGAKGNTEWGADQAGLAMVLLAGSIQC